MKSALLSHARGEFLATGYVSEETRADLRMVGVESAELEAYLRRTTRG